MQDIHNFNHDPRLTTQDIVTCTELGMNHYECVFDFYVGANVSVVSDVLRPSPCAQTGVVVKYMYNSGIVILMDKVLEEDVC